MSEPVVITGAGLITSIGAGLDEFSSALFEGRVGTGHSGVIELDGTMEVVTCEVPDFTPQRWLGPKGIRVLDRSARLLAVAAQLCLEAVGRHVDLVSRRAIKPSLWKRIQAELVDA